MQAATGIQEFLRSPYGRYHCGRRYLMFAHSPKLIGYACWGYPDADDIRELLRLCEIGVARDAAPHRFLVDVRALELVDPRTFALFVEYTSKHRAALARKLLGQALLVPDGLVGAIITGFSHIARLSYPARVFGDVAAALSWLQLPPEDARELIAELDAIRAQATGIDETVRRIRELLFVSRCTGLDEVARRLGLSRRTCQRALRDAGTTFRLELAASRIRKAKDFLAAGDRKLSWIAAELGFSSAQHFATAFRRATGETPSAWRDRQQRGPSAERGSSRGRGP